MPDREAPSPLRLVESFVNTVEHNPRDADVETLTSPEALGGWMTEHGIPFDDDLDDGDVRRAIEFREALRKLLRANNGAPLEPEALEKLQAAAEDGLIHVEIDAQGQAVTRPRCTGVEAIFARLLAAVADSQAAGTWERLKACAEEECEWAFYDSSRNRSRTWCSMEVCGNLAKTRAYRERRKKT